MKICIFFFLFYSDDIVSSDEKNASPAKSQLPKIETSIEASTCPSLRQIKLGPTKNPHIAARVFCHSSSRKLALIGSQDVGNVTKTVGGEIGFVIESQIFVPSGS